jgi:hypothetical protein
MICMICRKEEVVVRPRRVVRRGMEDVRNITCAKKIIYYFILFLLSMFVYVSFLIMYSIYLNVKRVVWKQLASS